MTKSVKTFHVLYDDSTGTLIYGHYGRPDDFEVLRSSRIGLNRSIALIRFGGPHPSKVVSVILFSCSPLRVFKLVRRLALCNISKHFFLYCYYHFFSGLK